MKLPQAAIELVKTFEGYSPLPYRCPAGKLTVFWGHVIVEGEEYLLDGGTTEEAERILADDLKKAQRAVEKYVDVALTANQFGALASFVFNIGPPAFKASTMRRLINQGRIGQAAEEFPRWVFANKVKLPGLVKRRSAERALFLSADLSGADV